MVVNEDAVVRSARCLGEFIGYAAAKAVIWGLSHIDSVSPTRPSEVDLPEWVPPARARKIVDVSNDTLKAWAKKGIIGYMMSPQGRWMFKTYDLLNLAKEKNDG